MRASSRRLWEKSSIKTLRPVADYRSGKGKGLWLSDGKDHGCPEGKGRPRTGEGNADPSPEQTIKVKSSLVSLSTVALISHFWPSHIPNQDCHWERSTAKRGDLRKNLPIVVPDII
jgi:hypothetical protein